MEIIPDIDGQTFRAIASGQEELPVVVLFYDEWRGAYHMLRPIVEELAREYEGQVLFRKISSHKHVRVTDQYRIGIVPTLLVFRQGELLGSLVGMAPRQAIVELLDEKVGCSALKAI